MFNNETEADDLLDVASAIRDVKFALNLSKTESATTVIRETFAGLHAALSCRRLNRMEGQE